jgi:hypothetical protein
MSGNDEIFTMKANRSFVSFQPHTFYWLYQIQFDYSALRPVYSIDT